MAPEDVYEAAIRVMLDCNEVDALILGVVPLTAALKTAPEEVEDPASLAQRIPALFAEASKPMIVVVDSGPRYDPLVRQLRLAGVPVFPSADQAVRSLGRYLCHRAGDTESARTGEKTQEVVVAP
jgi:acyl-CoA synthetase (NDP forming)